VAALAEPTLAWRFLRSPAARASTNLGEIAARTMADPLSAASPRSPARLRGALHRDAGRDRPSTIDNPATHLELTMIHEAMVP